MCGIFGFLGTEKAAPILFKGLKRLEYRGYDSAGLATVGDGGNGDNGLYIKKDVGMIDDVHEKLNFEDLPGNIGLAHTRWATHGGVTKENAHPHIDCGKAIAVVHNGIIDNYQQLRALLEEKGHVFDNTTDSGVIPHLIEELYKEKLSLEEAVKSTTKHLDGMFAIAVISSKEPDKIVAACYDMPLVIGLGRGEYFPASDILAFLDRTKNYVELKDGDVATIMKDGVRIYNNGKRIQREIITTNWTPEMAEKKGYQHYMLKEINEQPEILKYSLKIPIEQVKALETLSNGILNSKLLYFVACGTSYNAGVEGEYLCNNLLKIPAQAKIASEFEDYSIVDNGTTVIAISQSGETKDVLRAVKYAKRNGASVLSIVNRPESVLTRVADETIYMNAGPEIGVAATKTYTAELLSLYQISLHTAKQQGKDVSVLEQELRTIPSNIQRTLTIDGKIKNLAERIAEHEHVYFIGRGVNYPTAREGALKLKEISYIHAEAFPGGELKHGPLPLIDKDVPVITILQRDERLKDILINSEEAKSRGAYLIAVKERGHSIKNVDETLEYSTVHPYFSPVVNIIPLQLLAYHTAVVRGENPDKPKSLAKSITVR